MKIREAQRNAREELSASIVENVDLDVDLLLAKALGTNRTYLYTHGDEILDQETQNKFISLLNSRRTGKPIAYLLNEKAFFKSTFFVDERVLIPRPETEELVNFAVSLARLNERKLRILDLGTGSGCVGLSVIKEWPDSQLVAIDNSQSALEVAQVNARELGVQNRVQFLNCDVVDLLSTKEFKRSFDVITANPPYISENETLGPGVREYEPHVALFSHDNGMGHTKKWLEVVSQVLKPGGRFIFEIGFNQGHSLLEFAKGSLSFSQLEIKTDLSGKDRYLIGNLNG